MSVNRDSKSLFQFEVLVTGGAGFIGSQLVDVLMKKGKRVCVLDNLSSGSFENIKRWVNYSGFSFIRGDLLNRDAAEAVRGCETVFHLAADPMVRLGSINPKVHFEQNVIATYNLLEAVRRNGNVKAFIFTSSSTVYGEASEIPTPEDAPLKPISIYGASKMASEALVGAYAHTYGFKAVIYRQANITGPRSRHGVIYDFIQKLREEPDELEILGDGTQMKSYLYIDDCIEAMLLGLEKSSGRVEVFNLGSEDWTNVETIAKIVVEEMGLNDVAFRFTGGVDGGRGWIGDVKYMLLNVSKLRSLGWKAKFNSVQAVKIATKNILKEIGHTPL